MSSMSRKKQRLSNLADDGRKLASAKKSPNATMNQLFYQEAAKILPSDFAISLCVCRVPENIEGGEEYASPICRARDTFGNESFPCSMSVRHQQLIRPHTRVPFIPVCEGHRARMRLHQCCPTCGEFCVKGRFVFCREADPPHLCHIQCVNINGRCPHCGSDKVGEKDFNLEQNVFMTKLKARMSVFSVDPYAAGAIALQEEQHVRNQTYGVPGSSFEICTMYLADANHREAIRKAVEHASKVFSNSVVMEHNFVEAVKKNDLMLAILCLSKGISPNTRLGPAAMPEIQPGRSPGTVNATNQTALHVAAFADFGLLAYVLIEVGADVNLVDSEGRNALMYAIKEKHRCLSLMLLKAGTKLDTKDNSADTALHFAAVQGDPELVKHIAVACMIFDNTNLAGSRDGVEDVLIKNGRKKLIDAQDNGGWTPLMWAAEKGHAEAVRHLLHFGAKTDIIDDEGNIALHWAAMSGADEIVIPLVDKSKQCEINCQNRYGDTPLILACQKKFQVMAEYLIRKNADFTLKNVHGCSANDVCQSVGDEETETLIGLRNFLKRAPYPPTHIPKGRVILADLSKGREPFAVPVINDVDSDVAPQDFRYIRSLIEKETCHIIRGTSLIQCCSCDGDCEESCSCKLKLNCDQSYYDKEGTLIKEYEFAVPQPEIFECSEVCSCSATSCVNRVAQKGLSLNFLPRVRLQIRKTLDKGWGVFAAEDIPYGTFVCEYAGELLLDEQAEGLDEDSYLFDLSASDVLVPFVIDAKRCGNVARFINHSCEPNVWPIRVYWDHQDMRAPHICFFARQPIKANDEISFDYGTKFWSIKGEMFSCICASPFCKYSADKIDQFLENSKQNEQQDKENTS